MPAKRLAPGKLGPVISTGRAISCQRVSTQGQATEDKSSFERQQESFEAWCAAHPEHPPLETYRVARSGAEAGRFDWLMDGVKRGDFMPGDVLVVESINRFSREEMSEALSALLEISMLCALARWCIMAKVYHLHGRFDLQLLEVCNLN